MSIDPGVPSTPARSQQVASITGARVANPFLFQQARDQPFTGVPLYRTDQQWFYDPRPQRYQPADTDRIFKLWGCTGYRPFGTERTCYN